MSEAQPLDERIQILETTMAEHEKQLRELRAKVVAREPHAITAIRARFGITVTKQDLALLAEMVGAGAPEIREGRGTCTIHLCRFHDIYMQVVYDNATGIVVTVYDATASMLRIHGANADDIWAMFVDEINTNGI